MSDQSECDLGVGAGGVIRFLRDLNLPWEKMTKEWVDNAYGAGATHVKIIRNGEETEIRDDGRGCDDLRIMEAISESIPRSDDKASMYGTGGIWSQIHASQGGVVEVTTTTAKGSQKIIVDFGECIRSNRYKSRYFPELPVPPNKPTGTVIRIKKAKRFGNTDSLAEELGHSYAVELRAGKKITIVHNGKVREVKPYQIPSLTRRVEINFDFQGHSITGFCGVVKEGVDNPYSGWSVHWGYRFAKTTTTPAGSHLAHRIYGEIYLPSTWKNINPTKDNFSSDAGEFWEEIARQCAEVIELADDQSTDLELLEASELVSGILTEAVAGGNQRRKGRRPGSAGKRGAVDPTGNGSPHANFGTHQEGTKPTSDAGTPTTWKAPSKIRVAWDETLKVPYHVASSRNTMTITLNKSMAPIEEFKKDIPKLTTLCCFAVAHARFGDPENEGIFPSFKGEEYQEFLSELLNRVKVAGAAVAK